MYWLLQRRFAVLVLLLAIPGLAAAVMTAPEDDEQEISEGELPGSIRQALRDVDVEDVEVTEIYEIGIEEDGVEIELRLTADGRLLGIRVESGDDDNDDDSNRHDDDVDDDEEDGDEEDEDEDEQSVSLESIPAAVRSALGKLADGNSIESVEREKHDGRVQFEATWTVDGIEHEAAVTADGILIELQEAVAADTVPEAVRRISGRHFDGRESLEFERKLIAAYEVENDEQEILLTPTGRRIEIEGDEE
ncbi:MAG: hypothetical protein R3C19_14660 [Planctomycetaceae bacterium]